MTTKLTLIHRDSMKSASDGYKDNAYIHTQAGRFYASEPTWDIHAIAHALGQKARYCGNADQFYSVAEHAVLVSLLMQEVVGGDPLEGLHHDDTESVLPDVAAPFKQLFPDLSALDRKFEHSVRTYFDLPVVKTDHCTKADWLALFIESAQILPERGIDFEDPYKLRPIAMDLRANGWRIQCLSWQNAKAVYLRQHQTLTGK